MVIAYCLQYSLSLHLARSLNACTEWPHINQASSKAFVIFVRVRRFLKVENGPPTLAVPFRLNEGCVDTPPTTLIKNRFSSVGNRKNQAVVT